MKKDKFNIEGINNLTPKELRGIKGGSFIGKLLHAIGYVIGVIGDAASDIAAGGSNFLGD